MPNPNALQWPGGEGGKADLSFQDLSRRLRMDRRFYRMLGAECDEDSIVLKGGFFLADFRSGLHIHGTDAVEQQSGATETRLEPQLTVAVVLSGRPLASIEGVSLDPAPGPAAHGKMWSVTRPAWLRRCFSPGQRVRKVNVSVDPAWLRDFLDEDSRADGPLRRFAESHLAVRDWSPPPTGLRAAEEMLSALSDRDRLSRLSLEIRALAILHDALASLDAEAGEAAAAGGRTPSRAHAVWQYIDRHVAEPLTLDGIAAGTGMSVSTLQRIFKETYGLTVVEHLRATRLDLARRALVEDGLPIQQAAHLAGYASAANFATAFKRRFGHSPSEVGA